jgi:hypothetical protein
MKRKLIVTLVASALELYAAAATAQVATCNLVGTATTASAATPVRTGPLSPVSGFPEYVTDSNGVSVQRCLDANFCFFDPVVATDPFSLQIGSGGEAFYWGADGVVSNAAGNRILSLGMAAETAFLQVGPNGEPINGSQFPFLRLRFTMGVPVDGTYTVVHPYGTDQFTVTGATGARDVFATVDKGLSPSATITGPVGPFLKWDPRFAIVPAGFLGDGGVAGAAQPVVGSPCGVNYIEITGVDTAGRAVDFGVGETVLRVDSFSVQGQIYDGRVQTPLAATRNTYSRAAVGGQIDSFVASTANAVVTVKDGPTIPVGTSRIPTALNLDRSVLAIDATAAVDSRSTVLPTATTLPPILSITANDALTTLTTAAGVTQRAFDPTTLNVPLVDFVDISLADYDPTTGILTVMASSGDAQANPALTLRDFGTTLTSGVISRVATTAPPGAVTVDSAGGGRATHLVRVVQSAVPVAPATLGAPSVSSTTVTLRWADSSNNESGFRVYSVNTTTGARSLLTTTAANVTSFVVTGLAPLSTTTFQVDAFNLAGAASSPVVTTTTLALPVAPSAVVAALSSTPARSISLSFNDNSTDETRFNISRATVAAGPYTDVGTLTGAAITGTGVRTFVDSSAALANNTTYFYRVTADRVIGAVVESSTAAQTALGVATPNAPASIAAPTFAGVTSNSVTVNWAAGAAVPAGAPVTYDIYRSTLATGGFVQIGFVAAGVLTFTDNAANNPTSPPVAGTTYFYRVNAVNWAAAVNGAVSTGVTPQATPVPPVPPVPPVGANLVAPTGVTASTATRPVLGWTDASTGETSYRVSRTPITVNATTGATTAGATTIVSSTIARLATPATGGVMSFTDRNGQANDNTFRYDIQALNGATAGPVSSVYAITTALPSVATPTTAAILGGGIRLNWTASTTQTVGGYEILRCTGALCRNFTPLATVAGRISASFSDTTATAVGTTYRYRIRTVGGVGTNVTPSTTSGTATRVR